MTRKSTFTGVPAADVLSRIDLLKSGTNGATFVEVSPKLVDGKPVDGAIYTLIATYAT